MALAAHACIARYKSQDMQVYECASQQPASIFLQRQVARLRVYSPSGARRPASICSLMCSLFALTSAQHGAHNGSGVLPGTTNTCVSASRRAIELHQRQRNQLVCDILLLLPLPAPSSPVCVRVPFLCPLHVPVRPCLNRADMNEAAANMPG